MAINFTQKIQGIIFFQLIVVKIMMAYFKIKLQLKYFSETLTQGFQTSNNKGRPSQDQLQQVCKKFLRGVSNSIE